MVLITVGAATIAPQQVLDISSERQTRTIVHTILGRAEPDITVRAANLRTGTLQIGFQGETSEADSRAAETALAAGGVFTISAPERPTLEMSAVPQGSITRALEPESRDAWLITLGYQEVSS